MSDDRDNNDSVEGIDPDIVPTGEPEPALGAPGGSDSTVGTTPEGAVNDPDADAPDTDDTRLTDESGSRGI